MTDDRELLEKAKNLAYFYLKFRPRTEKETRDYLEKKKRKHKLTSPAIQQAVKELKAERLVNDTSFIIWHVERRSRAKPKAKFLLTQELIKYGVPKDLITEYFQEKVLDEAPLAMQAIRSRWVRWSSFPKEKRFEKAARFLQSRGFSYSVIKNTIADLEKEE